MVLDYAYLRWTGLDHQQALYKLKLYELLDAFKQEMRGANRPEVLETIKANIAGLHDAVKEYTASSVMQAH